MLYLKLILTIVLVTPQFAWGWGALGHQITGAIAEDHLTPQARKALQKITRGESLKKLSTWADRQRSNPKMRFLNTFHYTTVPDGESYNPNKTRKRKDVIQAIEWTTQILSGELQDSRINEKQALALLVHFIGDLHQPLHVGRYSDRGGNSVRLLWFGKKSNLHRIWDSGILKKSKMRFNELVKAIHKKNKIRKSWLGKDIIDWADESISYREQVYSFEGMFFEPFALASFYHTPGYEHNHAYSHDEDFLQFQQASFFKRSRPRSPSLKLGERYFEDNWPLTQKRLLQAGIRIAEVLNQVFSK